MKLLLTLLRFFANFTHNRRIFMSKVLYLHDINCVFDEYKHFNIMTCQMWLKIMGRSLILLRYWVFLYIIDDHSCLVHNLYQTFTDFVSNQYTYFDISTCQMWLEVIECRLILMRFFGHFHTFLLTICV